MRFSIKILGTLWLYWVRRKKAGIPPILCMGTHSGSPHPPPADESPLRNGGLPAFFRRTRLHLTVAALLFFHFNLSAQTIQKRPAVSSSSGTIKNADMHRGHEHELQLQVILLNKNLLRPQKESYKYNEPADLIELVPILRDLNRMIPRQFSLAEHEFRLDPHNITISHEWLDLRTRSAKKNSIISLTYTSPAGYFGSRLDVPLFYSSSFGFSDWSRYPLGNYTMVFDRNNPFSQDRAFYIKALTRF